MGIPRNKNISVVYTPGAVPPFGLRDNIAHPLKQQVSFRNHGQPGVMVYFNIVDPDNTGIEFQEVPGDALWVRAAAPGLPAPPCQFPPSSWEGFVPLSVEQDDDGRRTQLIVYCRNREQQMFRFMLRFVLGGAPVDYDPIGDGLNGPRGGF